MTTLQSPPIDLRPDRCFIDGNWVGADDGRRSDVDNPATGEVIATVPNMGATEVRRAISAAQRTQRPWADLVAADRARVLHRWCDLLLAEREPLAHILTLEQGKPLAEARGEISYAASFVRFYAEEATRIAGETIPAASSDTRIVVLRQPIGVVGAITPWNFPAAMVTRKAAPALAAGCSVVLKPDPNTPLSALAIAALAERAGLAPGLLNIVTGAAEAIGSELCSNPAVRALSFTGSTTVGRLLAAQCAPTLKKLAFELGGNAPFIVFDDADLDAAVDGALLSKFRHSGQTCVCTNRFFIQDGIYDAFVERFLAKVTTLEVGNGLTDGVDIGPLINDRAVLKVSSHVEDALSHGAVLLTGGERDGAGICDRFYPPTVLGEVTTRMRVASEETFGPVAALFRFGDEDEALELANDTEYGLAGYFYSRDVGRAWRVAERLETGMVGINSAFLSVEVAPFGGIKQSGLGREGSRHGIEEYLEMKYLAFGGVS